MKKINFLLIALILVACTPQVTVTSEVAVTSPPPTQTPIPTPTLHPDFVALQNLLSDLSETLTLLPNGQIEAKGVAIPNLQVDQNGKITILVNGEKVAVNASDITFDDDGLTINGYELNENGEWVEAEETVKLDNGLILTLENADGDGISVVTNVAVENDDLSEKQKELLINQLNPGYVGFTPDEAKLYYDAETQSYWVGSADDPSNVIARQDGETGTFIWDFDKMKDENGESILFRIAHIWEMKGVEPVDMETARMDSQELDEKRIEFDIASEYYKMPNISKRYRASLSIYHYNSSGDLAIGACLIVDDSANPTIVDRVDESGRVCFLSRDRQIIVFMVENFDSTTRFWR